MMPDTTLLTPEVAQNQPEQSGVTEQVTSEQPQEQPAQGTEYVDFSPEQKRRFDRIYFNMKEYERDNSALRQHIAQLTEAVNAMQAGSAQQQEAVQRQRIMQQMLQAKEAGNIQEEVRLQGELTTLGQRAPKPVPLPPPPQTQNADISAVESWSREVAGDGNFKRPWALEGHPRYAEAYNLVASMVTDPRFNGNTDAILAEVDRRMGVQGTHPRPPGATVLSGGQVRPQVETEAQLSQDELQVARKMGLSPKDYALQVKLINQHSRGYSVPTVASRRPS
jgi:hypothetical protein